MEENRGDIVGDIVKRAINILSEYPLCNSCLGRIFAKYGIGLGNHDRGLAIKTMIAMKLHHSYLNGEVDREYIYRLTTNSGEPLLTLYEKLFNERLDMRKCYICSGKLSRELVEKIAIDICLKLRELDIRSFIVGISLDSTLSSRELEIMSRHGTESSESIKRELKREIGKSISSICKISPEFTRPDVVVVVNVDSEFNHEISIQQNPLFYKGYYWKTRRGIPHTPRGDKRIELSIHEITEKIFKEIFHADKIIVHSAGREDIDTRVLGSGRPVVIEVKSPRIRNISLEYLKTHVEETTRELPIYIEITSQTTRSIVRYLKEYVKRKKRIYRVSVLSDEYIELRELVELENRFKSIEVRQKISRGIRGIERERVRKVYSVKTYPISSRLFEAIINCEGGLRIRELINCNGDETRPCFTSVLGKRLTPLEVDILYIEE